MRRKQPPLKILLVDPDNQTCKHYWQFLREYGQVNTAADVFAAELQYLRHRPHIIITELHHPFLDGAGLLQRFKRQFDPQFAYSAIGLISPGVSKPVSPDYISAELKAVIPKPVIIGDLLSKVRHLGKAVRELRASLIISFPFILLGLPDFPGIPC